MIALTPTSIRHRLSEVEECLRSLHQHQRDEGGLDGLDAILEDPVGSEVAGQAYDVMYDIYHKNVSRGQDPSSLGDTQDRARMNVAYARLQEHLGQLAPDITETTMMTTTRMDRDPATGKFACGNKLATGNPFAKQAAAFRREIMSAVEPEEMRKVIRKLLDEALKGNVVAARELLTRCVGEPVPYDVLARLEELERMVEEAKAWA